MSDEKEVNYEEERKEDRTTGTKWHLIHKIVKEFDKQFDLDWQYDKRQERSLEKLGISLDTKYKPKISFFKKFSFKSVLFRKFQCKITQRRKKHREKRETLRYIHFMRYYHKHNGLEKLNKLKILVNINKILKMMENYFYSIYKDPKKCYAVIKEINSLVIKIPEM